ncbi:transposase [Streptomyces sp. NPDC094438]|uniref:transposase n=1 Tax=Streptomyces sp. NPDC094438 TaxID=3366061 RepID=UPI0038113550
MPECPAPRRSAWSPACWTPQLAPARQLAMIYHERWEIENSYAELKNRLRGAAFILRSRAPELIRQEVYALLTVYQAL